MSIKKIKDNVYAITDGSTRGNVAAYVLPSQIVFVDSGMHIPLIKKFREHIERETGKKASVLFITHAHGDHVFGNQIFEDCEIITSELTHKAMVDSQKNNWTPEALEEWKKNSEDPLALDGLKIVLANKTFADEYELVDRDVKVIVKRTGGHTAGSSYVYCPNYKVMFAGDNLFNHSFPWGGTPTSDPLKWVESIQEYLSLDVENYIPGHGSISGKETLEEFLAYLNKVISLMKEMIAEGKTEEEILEQADKIDYYPSKREQWKALSLKKWYEVITS
ncbi:MAG: MBL fold metallo-hydrolase [Candidatus Heimdallarchaeota archaeon]|nr:MBL fold metallo-hydrolase [Candidatus Heimdallarchaeota archaeon]MCK5144203.1 MBL fold metallo-hydrolase [Candidatus Heimdallarchaeota archaeon]